MPELPGSDYEGEAVGGGEVLDTSNEVLNASKLNDVEHRSNQEQNNPRGNRITDKNVSLADLIDLLGEGEPDEDDLLKRLATERYPNFLQLDTARIYGAAIYDLYHECGGDMGAFIDRLGYLAQEESVRQSVAMIFGCLSLRSTETLLAAQPKLSHIWCG